ncbi:MAG: response regulator, partial [Desulfobacteraceae bacterium]
EEGTGLGLSVVHGIVKKHGGHLTFSSKVGKGTTFQILFPKISAAKAVESTAPEQALPGGTEHIWVLDDDAAIALIAQKMVQNLGYTARVFTRSDQLIDEFKKNGDRVDLIITDMTMPDRTGAELARLLIDLRADIPIILCTGFNESIDAAKAKAIGIREFLMKPVVLEELAAAVRKVLDEKP